MPNNNAAQNPKTADGSGPWGKASLSVTWQDPGGRRRSVRGRVGGPLTSARRFGREVRHRELRGSSRSGC